MGGGKDIRIGPGCSFTPSTIYIGSHVYFGPNSIISSAHGKIIIGNHVMFGPGVNIHGGNHKVDVVGMYMDDVKKKFGDDPDLIIGDDVWIGANAIILKGVVIGEGSVIGAGSVVTKSTEPYSVNVGNPARKIAMRFSEAKLLEHRRLMTLSSK